MGFQVAFESENVFAQNTLTTYLILVAIHFYVNVTMSKQFHGVINRHAQVDRVEADVTHSSKNAVSFKSCSA